MKSKEKEWICMGCNTVYPGPPGKGPWCVVCPRCSGDCMPRSRAEIKKLKREVAGLREALKLSLAELSFAPCRDNPDHSYCLKCRAAKIADQALARTEKNGG